MRNICIKHVFLAGLLSLFAAHGVRAQIVNGLAAPSTAAASADAAGLQAIGTSTNAIIATFLPTTKSSSAPGNKTNHGTDIALSGFTFQHVDEWKYGSNEVVLGAVHSNGHEPAANSHSGATSVSLIYRGLLSMNRVFATDAFRFGPINDVRLKAGLEYSRKDTPVEPRRRVIEVGPNIAFHVMGYLNMGLYLTKEWNQNAVHHVELNYDPQVTFAVGGMQPLDQVLKGLRIEVSARVSAPKGRDAVGRQTTTEWFCQPRLVLDLGKAIGARPQTVDIFVGVQYWYNKAGANHSTYPGTDEQTAIIGLTYYLP